MEKSKCCSCLEKRKKPQKLPPSLLLSVWSKIFEKLIFIGIFKFLIENDLISTNQSGFKPGDSHINQLFSKTPESCKSFDCGYEVRGVFLGISKAFDKVWHDSVMFKSEQNGTSDNLW